MTHAIISVHPPHALSILGGDKSVEIRTRHVALKVGSFLWIYSTLPVGQIQAVARVQKIHRLSPARAWSRFESQMALRRTDYLSYVNGSKQISVIKLSHVV